MVKKISKILPPNSLNTQFVPHFQNVASDLNKTRNQLTINGTHYGIEVYGKVFDNLSQQGLSRDNWLNDLHCPSEEFELEVVEEF